MSPRWWAAANVALMVVFGWAQAHAAGASARVSLRWKPVDGAAGYELEIARDSGFRDVVVRERTKVAGYRWNELPRVPYFWRVRSVDADNRFGDWSSAERIDPAVSAPEPASPASDAVVLLGGTTLELEVKAHASPLLREYSFELSRDPNFASGVQQRRSAGATTRFVLDGPGVWHWRVRGTDLAGRDAGVSAAQRLEARLGPPELDSPPQAAQLPWNAGSSVVPLRWKRQPHARGYVVEVKDGAGAPRTTRVETPQLDLPVSAPTPVSWRVAAVEESGRLTPFSPARTLSFAVGAASPVSPAANDLVRVRSPGAAVRFAWTLPAGASGAEVEIARGPNFSAPVLRLKADGATAETTLPGAGPYQWRVTARGARGVTFDTSTAVPFELKVATPPRPPVMAQPAHDAVLPSEGGRVRLAWAAVAGAVRYELQVDEHEEARASETTHVLQGLGEGEHTVRIRAVDDLELASEWSAPIAFHLGVPRTAKVEFDVAAELAADGESATDLRFRLLDARGRVVRGVQPEIRASAGVMHPARADGDGFRAHYVVPSDAPPGGAVEVRVIDRGFEATARVSVVERRRRVQLAVRPGWSAGVGRLRPELTLSALSSPYVALDASWEPGWWMNHLALAGRVGLHGGDASFTVPGVEGTYSVQTRVVPVTAMLLYQSAFRGWRLRGGVGAGVHLVRSRIAARWELVVVPAATAAAEVSRRVGPGRVLAEVGYAAGFVDGEVADGRTGGLFATLGYGVDL